MTFDQLIGDRARQGTLTPEQARKATESSWAYEIVDLARGTGIDVHVDVLAIARGEKPVPVPEPKAPATTIKDLDQRECPTAPRWCASSSSTDQSRIRRSGPPPRLPRFPSARPRVSLWPTSIAR
jgi:hypothetical protein